MNDNPNKADVQGLPVKGYRPQSQANVDLVNNVKVAEENVLRMLDAMAAHPEYDKRWLAIARTHVELGFMAANRAVFRPDRLTLPGDEEYSDGAGVKPV